MSEDSVYPEKLTSFRVTAICETAHPIEWSFLHSMNPIRSSTVPNLSYGANRKFSLRKKSLMDGAVIYRHYI